MTRWRFPLWLLRDAPALLAVVTSFWPLVILVIACGCRAMRGVKTPRPTIDLIAELLVHAEIRLDHAISREAYRRLGWDARAVQHLDISVPTGGFSELIPRIRRYRDAFLDMETCVRAYVDVLRKQHNIPQRALTRRAYGRPTANVETPCLSNRLHARSSAHDGEGRLRHRARGPPHVPNYGKLTSPACAERERVRAPR